MKLYFFTKNSNHNLELQSLHSRLVKFLKDSGVMVLSNLDVSEQESSNQTFANMDGLIVEGTEAAMEAGYLIALALSQSKPILYLLKKGTALPEQLKSLTENQQIKKQFGLKHYTTENLNDLLIDFVDLIETGELRREVPTIKFTLRFTPRADRFLTWKSRRLKASKADYLRQLINEQIKNDDDYQGLLKREEGD